MSTGTCLCKEISIEVNGEQEHPPGLVIVSSAANSLVNF